MTRLEPIPDAPPPSGVTIASLWSALTDPARLDDALDWPPDLFALVDRALEASEAYRFVVSPLPGAEFADIAAATETAADWCRWLDGESDTRPAAVLGWWKVVRDALDLPIDDLSAGRDWHVIEALLTLHAVSDEACAGLGSATAVAPGPGASFRAAARELLAERGSLSRLSPGVLRVLPRCRASIGGISIQSLSRHVCVRGPQVDVEWHRIVSRPTRVSAPEERANALLLPWPLRVRARDFSRAAFTLPHMDTTETGFFEFDPAEPFDLALVEGVLQAAVDEAGTLDVVIMPEAAITPADIGPLESLLGDYGVWSVIAGVREPPGEDGLGANWVHVGVRQEVVWRHAKQHKHHRWCLDGRQIRQYHLGGALSARMRWWEAVSIPRRSLQVIDEGTVTLVPMLCEDLARFEPVADLVRAIGPSLVITLLLDGPQLSSRWTARYASVLADDPGSAVCTLTSYGMVRRCVPPDCEPSSVVALWKDASGEVTEISLDEGADAVLIATSVGNTGAVTADGRRHAATSNTLTLAAFRSLRASERAPRHPAPAADTARASKGLPPLDERELSKATSWVEALAETAALDPGRLDALMQRATALEWRAPLGLPPPSRLFCESIASLRRELPEQPTLHDIAVTAARLQHADDPAGRITGTLISIALEQRLVTEVRMGRRSPDVLDALAPGA